jgi:hypothetical protein
VTETQQPPFDPLGSVAWPVRTARLLLRRAEARDAESTWTCRQLPWNVITTSTWNARFPGSATTIDRRSVCIDGVSHERT